jgi:hemoglobin
VGNQERTGSTYGSSEAEVSGRHIPGGEVRDQSMPYRSSPLFTAETLPQALQREHRTKRGVWGVIRVFEGTLRYCKEDGSSDILRPGIPGLIPPDEPHHVELIGPVSMQVDFFDHKPVGLVG